MTKLAFAIALAMAVPLAAQAWTPEKDVNVIVAYKAGSGTDTGARLLMTLTEKEIGKAMIINNLPGADGKIGWTRLVKSKPDGYTIGYINLPTFTTLANEKNAPFKITQIDPIANHLTETGVVVVRADSKWQTLNDLVKDAKASDKYRCSTNGVKASNHTAAQLLSQSAGFKYKAIPYGGTADQLMALRQGEVDFSCAKVADVAKLVSGEKPELRILGVFATKRLAEYPNVPTLGELGYYDQWYGSARAIVAPAGMPEDVLKYWVDTFKKVLNDPAVKEAHEKGGLTIDYQDNQQLGELIKSQDVFARDVIAKLY